MWLEWRLQGLANEEYTGLGFREADAPSALLRWWWRAPVMFTICAWELPFEKQEPHTGWNCSGVNIFILLQEGTWIPPSSLRTAAYFHSFCLKAIVPTVCLFSFFPVQKGVMTGHDKHVWVVCIKGWTLILGTEVDINKWISMGHISIWFARQKGGITTETMLFCFVMKKIADILA